MAARQAPLRRLAQQLSRSLNSQSSFARTSSSRRSAGAISSSERQGVQAMRNCERSRLLRQRTNMLPTLVGRSSRSILMAFRAMHHTLAIYGLDDDGT